MPRKILRRHYLEVKKTQRFHKNDYFLLISFRKFGWKITFETGLVQANKIM